MSELLVDVELRRGSFTLTVHESLALTGTTAVFGASGSGKTTLLRVIAGLEPAAHGTIRFGNTAWLEAGRSLPAEARAVGMVFQDGRLFPHLNVRDNLMYPIRHGRRRGPITFDRTVGTLGLESLLERTTHDLSGGERQRVAIGRALLAAPALLLMDEPLSSLDRERKRELLPLIRSLPERFDVPVLYVTHDVDELIYVANDVVLLEAGRAVARGSPADIFRSSEFSILEATVTAHADSLTLASIAGHTLRVPHTQTPVGARLRLRVDPRDVIVATAAPVGLSIRNSFEAQVLQLTPRADGLVDVRLGIGDQRLTARVTPDAVTELGLEPAQRVHALIKTVALNPY
jgi:molybdate transport system ATP-binding protein